MYPQLFQKWLKSFHFIFNDGPKLKIASEINPSLMPFEKKIRLSIMEKFEKGNLRWK